MAFVRPLLVGSAVAMTIWSQAPKPAPLIPPNLKYLPPETGTPIASAAQGIDTDELYNTLRLHGIRAGGDCDLGVCECLVAPENAKRATAIALKLQQTGRFDITVAPDFKWKPLSVPHKSIVSRGCAWAELIEKAPMALQKALFKGGAGGTEEFRSKFPVARTIVYCTRWYRNINGVTVGYNVKLHGTSEGNGEWEGTYEYQVADSGASIEFRGGNDSKRGYQK